MPGYAISRKAATVPAPMKPAEPEAPAEAPAAAEVEPEGMGGPEPEQEAPAAPRRGRKRARNADGEFKGDDPSTPEVNEAWEPGEAG